MSDNQAPLTDTNPTVAIGLKPVSTSRSATEFLEDTTVGELRRAN